MYIDCRGKTGWKIHTGKAGIDERNLWQEFYSSYVATYLERDIHELIAADSITFTKFLKAVAARTGEMLNYKNIAGDVGVSEPTIKNWISILSRTGIILCLIDKKTYLRENLLALPIQYI